MSTSASSRGDRPEPLADPFDKKAWLEGVCPKKFDGSAYVCACGYNFGDGSSVDAEKARQHEAPERHRE